MSESDHTPTHPSYTPLQALSLLRLKYHLLIARVAQPPSVMKQALVGVGSDRA